MQWNKVNGPLGNTRGISENFFQWGALEHLQETQYTIKNIKV